jgi:hypothetical protein
MSSQGKLHFQTRTLAVLFTIGVVAWMVRANSQVEKGKEQDSKGTQNASGEKKDKSKNADLSSVTDKRQKRQLRWVLAFNTKDAKDYAKQLQEMGAILAVPEGKENRQFRVFRNLKELPIKGEIEDLTKVKMIFWIDDNEQSVKSLSKVLGFKEVPEFVIAFLPEKLEDELYEQEKKFQNRKEEEIEQTKFKIVWRGEKYQIQVAEQKLKKP